MYIKPFTLLPDIFAEYPLGRNPMVEVSLIDRKKVVPASKSRVSAAEKGAVPF